jgi:ABC-type sugar transport system permease subunit
LRAARRAWLFMAPALAVIALIALFPLAWTGWESLHRHDLRLPWTGQPMIGLGNYLRIAHDSRFRGALAHTALFTITSVALELILGLGLALLMNDRFRGRALVRVTVLLPWAIPTVVAALIFRFMFPDAWFVDAVSAWFPIILADVWKATPFVAILFLAGLQSIPPELGEAAAIDGASAWQRHLRITLPLLRPAILVVLIFRSLDAFRVFDLIYVLTGGGPGTSTEPVALYAFNALFQDLRFGYGAALSVVVFAVTFTLAILYIRMIGREGEA